MWFNVLRLRIVIVHLDPALPAVAQRAALRRIRQAVLPHHHGLTLLVGDLNLQHPDEPVLNDSDAPDAARSDRATAAYWEHLREGTIELGNEDPSRRTRRGNEYVGFSRIDRAFLAAAELDALALGATLRNWRDVTDVRVPSDHVPIVVRFRALPQARAVAPRIPDYIARDPAFGRRVVDRFPRECAALAAPTTLFERLAMLKEVMHLEARLMVDEYRRQPPTTPAAVTGRLTRIWRLLRAGRVAAAEALARTIPQALAAVARAAIEGDFSALRDLLRAASTERLGDQQRRLDNDTALPPEKRAASQAALRRKARLWAPASKCMHLAAVLMPDGLPLAGIDGASHLHRHWSEAFTAVGTTEAHRLAWLHQSPPPAAGVVEPQRADVDELLRHPKASAPGPDGVPYAAFAACAPVAAGVLWEVYEVLAVSEGSAAPRWFTESYLVLLPKGTSAADADAHDGAVRRAAKDTRPVQLSNTDSKLIASLANISLAQVAATTCGEHQRGFVTGRIIHDNAVTLQVMGEAFSHLDGAVPGFVLLDQATAFTSLEPASCSHVWRRRVSRSARSVPCARYTGIVLPVCVSSGRSSGGLSSLEALSKGAPRVDPSGPSHSRACSAAFGGH